jgi:hypothetical protein
LTKVRTNTAVRAVAVLNTVNLKGVIMSKNEPRTGSFTDSYILKMAEAMLQEKLGTPSVLLQWKIYYEPERQVRKDTDEPWLFEAQYWLHAVRRISLHGQFTTIPRTSINRHMTCEFIVGSGGTNSAWNVLRARLTAWGNPEQRPTTEYNAEFIFTKDGEVPDALRQLSWSIRGYLGKIREDLVSS